MLFWKKMPSLWIGHRITEFNEIETSHAIAALKIYLTLCLFSDDRGGGVRTTELTFTELSEKASLSRSLVNDGIKVLYSKGLIKNISGSKRKKIYTVDMEGELRDGWCKLPVAGIVSADFKIIPFQSMHNRYLFERVALQLYIYLLYARDNQQNFTLARKSTLRAKIASDLPTVNKAITYLIHIGLLESIKQKNSIELPVNMFHDSFYFHFKMKGSCDLTYKKTLKMNEDDVPF